MKKYLFVAGFAGALLAGCSSSDVETTYEKEVLKYRDIPVEFSSFVGNTADTRAGDAGSINLDSLKSASKGFGVFAYYHDNATYSETAAVNFMYNEKVTYDTSKGWTYSPVKYWPNEFQTSGDGGYSDNIDRLSFLAYAPWEGADGVNTHLDAGKKDGEDGEVGILGFGNKDWSEGSADSIKNNEVKGDIYVKYKTAKNPKNSVDLLYAAGFNDNPSKLKNLTKPTVNSKVQFNFAHALSRLEFAIRYESDGTNGTADNTTNDIISETTIKLNSITIKGDKLGETGFLNLATGTWSGVTATGNYVLNIDKTHSNINIGGEIGNQVVPGTYATVMGNTDKDYFMFIPNGETTFTVTANYTVTTTDEALADGKSVITNNIVNTVKFTPEAGKAYKLKLAIGMVSVKLDADVTAWPTSTEAAPVWLPVNKN